MQLESYPQDGDCGSELCNPYFPSLILAPSLANLSASSQKIKITPLGWEFQAASPIPPFPSTVTTTDRGNCIENRLIFFCLFHCFSYPL